MTVEPDEREIWLTVHEVAKVCEVTAAGSILRCG